MVCALDPCLEIGDLSMQHRGEVLILLQSGRHGLDVSVAHIVEEVETSHSVRPDSGAHVDHVQDVLGHFGLVPGLDWRDAHVLRPTLLVEAHCDEAGNLVGGSPGTSGRHSTDEHIVYVDVSAEEVILFALAHGRAQPAEEIPCSGVAYVDLPSQLYGADASLRFRNEVHGKKPLLEGQLRVLHNSACCQGCYMPARGAHELPGSLVVPAPLLAPRADETVGPALGKERILALLLRAEAFKKLLNAEAAWPSDTLMLASHAPMLRFLRDNCMSQSSDDGYAETFFR